MPGCTRCLLVGLACWTFELGLLLPRRIGKERQLLGRGGSLPALSLKDGLWSRLVPSHVILCQGEGGQAYASLGNATWASLTWPLNESGRTPDGLPMFQWSRGPTAWLYVTSPSEWFVIPSVAVRIRSGMVLRATGSAEPLMKYSLSHTMRVP